MWAAVTLRGCRVLLDVRVVLPLDLRRIDMRVRQQRILRQHEVLDLRLLRCLERHLVLVVELLDLGPIDLDVLGERLGANDGDGYLALLLEQSQEFFSGRTGNDVRRRDRLLHGGDHHVLAQLLLERDAVHILSGQEHLVAVFRELAVVLERRDGRDHLPQLRVRYAEALIAGFGRQQVFVDDLFEDRESHFRIVEHRRVEASAHHLPRPLLLFAQRLVVFRQGDLVLADRRDGIRRIATAKVVIDAEKRERNRHQEQDDLRGGFVLGD